MILFMAWIMAMVSLVYIYHQTHQVVYIRYTHLLICQSYLNESYF